MKTFDEFTRKFFGDDMVPSEGADDDSEFVIPECWKPKTLFQYSLINSVWSTIASSDNYPTELIDALNGCLNDFADRHITIKNKIVFDGDLNFTVATENSETIAKSALFTPSEPVQRLDVFIDGTEIPMAPSYQHTGMFATLIMDKFDSSKYSITLSNVDANTFADGEHHVVLSYIVETFDIEPKTYKELALAESKNGTISPIVANKMLPKTPEELAFALFTGMPLEFSSDLSEKPGGISGNDGDSK